MVPPKALIVTQYYRPELIGSAPFCGDIAEWLNRNGRCVTVLTGMPHYPDADAFPEYRNGKRKSEQINGVAVERVQTRVPKRGSVTSRLLSEGLFLLRGIWALGTGRIQRRPLIISLCPTVLSVVLGSLARSRGGRHIAIVHDIQSGLAGGLGMVGNGWFLRLMRLVERTVLNGADLILVLNHQMQGQLRTLGVQVPIDIMPIWADTKAIVPEPNQDARSLKILYSGNFGRKQGLDQLLALANELQRRGADIQMVLRGNGSQNDTVAAEVSAQGLRNVSLADLLPPDQLGTGLAEGDIHLVPQEPDAADFAVPSKIFNIMAAGRPFIATANPNSPLWKLRERSSAFVCVPPNNARAFADAVIRLAKDSALRSLLGSHGRQFVEHHLSKEKVLSSFMLTIDELYAP